MRKILTICSLLTICNLILWGFAIVRAGSLLSAPALAGAEETVPVVTQTPDPQPAVLSYLVEEPMGEAEPELTEPSPLLALTFDDGPSKDTTPLLLDGLRERGVHATFFVLGTRAERAPEIVLQAHEDGHAIGGHSYDHRSYFTKISTEALRAQLQKTDDAITAIIGGEPPLLVRPPYGAVNETVAQKTGKANILWNIDPRDWEVRDAENVYNNIIERAVDGGVVILHDIYASTVEGTLKAIDELQAAGWQFVTIPELFEAYDIPLEPGEIYRGPHN